MYSRTATRCAVKFTLALSDRLERVMLAGDFSEWKPVPMSHRGDGTHEAVLRLEPGTYEYKFIIDGRWVKDPENTSWVVGEDGTLNSVVTVMI